MRSYWRTPHHDRRVAQLDRERIEREMMHAEHDLAFGGEALMIPPPPYFPRPPSYVDSDPSPVKMGFGDSMPFIGGSPEPQTECVESEHGRDPPPL
jgi:hypothetical protein